MDQKELEKVLGKVLEQKITPQFDQVNKQFDQVNKRLGRIEEKLDATMEMCAKNTEEVTLLRDDFTDMGYVVERIETKLDGTIRRQDDASVKNSQLARRVLRLESKNKLSR